MGTAIATRERYSISERTEVAEQQRRATEAAAALNARCTPEEASRAVRWILGSYPNRTVVDADVYVRQLTILLSEYPAGVVERIAHPKYGVVAEKPFLPTLSEIREFADPLVAGMSRTLERARGNVAQIERRYEGPSEAEREEIGRKMDTLRTELKTGPLPANASQARKLGWPEWLWDEDEQSPEYKRRIALCERSQGSGEQLRQARIEAGMEQEQ